MLQSKLISALVISAASMLAVSPAASANTLLLPSTLKVLGQTNSDPGTKDVEDFGTGNSQSFNDFQSVSGDGFYSESTYALNPGNFNINFPRPVVGSLRIFSGAIDNQAETAGSVFFTITEDTHYSMTGGLAVTSEKALESNIYGAIWKVVGETAVLWPGSEMSKASGLISAAGTLSPDAPGTATKFEFRYSALLHATAAATTAEAVGFFNLQLGDGSGLPNQTPLPTVATAGVALFGAMGLRRTRRKA